MRRRGAWGIFSAGGKRGGGSSHAKGGSMGGSRDVKDTKGSGSGGLDVPSKRRSWLW